MQFVSLILLLLAHFVNGTSDSDALLELKKGIEEGPLRDQVLSSWNANSVASSDGCPQNWYGITCTEGHVTSIALNDLGLTGTFQFSALIGVPMLQNLSISNNLFKGIISPDVGSIGSLRTLDLSRNLFHGSIPSELMKLKNLASLNLSSNNIGGKIPTGLERVEQLKYLDLRFNGFSGDISSVLMQLQNVVYVDLSSNQFSGSLDLDLEDSTFVSTVQYLNVSHNALVGELFGHDGMPYFDNLVVFDASYNHLVGPIPSFSFVVSLRVLCLQSNMLSGSLPEALLRESSMILTELDLSLNQIEGPLGSITSATLKNLNLSSNKLSGQLPEKIGHCSFLDLSNNMLSGSVSRIWSWGNYVEVINLSSNSLTGTLSNRTSQFLRLTSLNLYNNSLEGPLPPLLGSFPQLNMIDLSLNQLHGSIPVSVFTSLTLVKLKLSDNSFTGPIAFHPVSNISSVASSQNLSLVYLDLSENSLSGPLPSEISNLNHLLYLDLSSNQFEGSIPGNLPDGLQEFNVSSNNLSGVVPDNLRKFPDSSFHPGNSLLIFPPSSSSPKDVTESTWRGKPRSHMRPAIRAALIASFVGGAAVIALLAILVYYIAQRPELRHRKNSSNKSTERKGIPQGDSSLSHMPEPRRNVEPPHGFLSIPQDHLLSSEMKPIYERGNTSAVLKGPTTASLPEPATKDDGISSPLSLFSYSTPHPNDPHLSENPIVLNVYSPDKLAGDLHLFNSSYLFTLEELSRAPAEVIGRSCHGMSYKATLNSGHLLSVKWLREGLAKGKKEFVREAKKLGNVRHPNLVSISGYYWGPKEHEKLIISDFIDAASLDLYLYETEPRKFPSLSLDQRLKIAIDVACCLNYLHNERAIPHGNLKSSNILLQTSDMNTLLTDYSLHRIMTSAGTAEQVLNAGALGYRPPEFANSSKPLPSLKSDVYAFGVILLELLTGKNAGEIISGNRGLVDLTDWVRLLAAENRATDCYDKFIPGVDSIEGPPQRLNDMLHVALSCTLPASERPDIRTIFENLSSIAL